MNVTVPPLSLCTTVTWSAPAFTPMDPPPAPPSRAAGLADRRRLQPSTPAPASGRGACQAGTARRARPAPPRRRADVSERDRRVLQRDRAVERPRQARERPAPLLH